MLNEVRRKPDKPRIAKFNGLFYCYDKSVIGTGIGMTALDSYQDWERQCNKYKYKPRPIGHN